MTPWEYLMLAGGLWIVIFLLYAIYGSLKDLHGTLKRERTYWSEDNGTDQ